MYRQIIDDPNLTRQESKVYEALRKYINSHLTQLPTVKAQNGETEPFDSVEKFMTAIKLDNAVTVWSKHFDTDHWYLTKKEYGLWRAVHDVYGHGDTWTRTNGVYGNFNFRGEIESLFTVAMDTKDVLVVEGAILETVQRNLTDKDTFYPFTNSMTRHFANEIVRMTG